MLEASEMGCTRWVLGGEAWRAGHFESRIDPGPHGADTHRLEVLNQLDGVIVLAKGPNLR
jgi:hypothetical protein